MQPSDMCVVDRPIVPAIEPARSLYSLAEFFVFDGDPYVAAVTRALFKRDPLPVEYLEFRELATQCGKLETIRDICARFYTNAVIADLDAPDPIAESISSSHATEIRQIVTDFRS